MTIVQLLRDMAMFTETSEVRTLCGDAADTIERLQAALVGLVGVSTREELEAMEVAMRMMPAPAEDKAASIDAIHALLSLLPKE